ncbi:hypothetical protein niasHT_009938 [Heterodera trifolii]|uniref:Effector protein n=1 Tax=Heterodera trifolii TaxID=157864 RepID=A0ABD2MDA2_9BILA
MDSFSTIVAFFFAILTTHFSLFYSVKCDLSLSDHLATFILSHTSAYEDTSEQQNLVELDLERVRELQQTIEDAIDGIVAEDGTFAGVYSCQPNMEFKFNGFSLSDENGKYLRSLLKAFECSGGKLKKVKKNQSEFDTAQWLGPDNSIFKFGILTEMEETQMSK